jgi:hypothetical protein
VLGAVKARPGSIDNPRTHNDNKKEESTRPIELAVVLGRVKAEPDGGRKGGQP